MVPPAYRFVERPPGVGHGHPMFVFDTADRLDRLDLPLTTFAREAVRRLSASSVRVYLYALLPFFTFLAGCARYAERSWNGDVESVRNAVAEYVEDHLNCVIRRHRLGFELVSVTGRTRGNVGAFLAALKLFYIAMRDVGCYTAGNPLVDVTSRVLGNFDDDKFDDDADHPPRMPRISGVEPSRSHRRLTDSFFKLVGKDRTPQIIDDPTFPVAVMAGGRKLCGLGPTGRVRAQVAVRDRWPNLRGNRAHAR